MVSKWTKTILTAVVGLALSGALAAAAPAEWTSQPGETALSAGPQPVGLYDVTFRLQLDRLEQSVTPLATLTVDVPEYPAVQYRQITPINFDAAGKSMDFVLRMDNWRPQEIAAHVTVTKPEAPAPALTVEKITIAPHRSVAIGTVWPGKVIYFTKEAASGMVSVCNGTAEAQTVILRTALESDLDRSRALAETPVKLAPGERKEVPVAWNTGAEEWGFALAATLADAAGELLDEKREYFSVADNLWSVGITQAQRGTNIPSGPGPNESLPVSQIQKWEQELAAVLAQPQPPIYWNYGNYNEFYAWAPEDFFRLAPTEDYWYSGTGSYTIGKKHMQMALAWLHRKGMRATTYTNPFVIGYGSEGICARHPEWFVYGANGQLAVGSYYEKKLEVGEQMTEEGPWHLALSPYAFNCNVNPARLEVIGQQEQQLVKSAKLFGWDGVRFDNAFYTAFGFDWQGKSITGDDPAKKNAIEARAWEYLRAELLKDLGPRYVTGTNCDYELRDRGPAAWDAVCRNGGLLMEEIPRSSWMPVSATNRWADHVAKYHQAGEAVRALGGHHLTIGFDRQYPVDHLYSNVFTYVDRTHPYANINSDNLPLGNYAAFITRYSALYWDVNRVKLIPNVEQRVKVDSPAAVWWKDYACVRQTPEGGRQYLINLVNPPAQERIMSDPGNKVPAPQPGVKVSLTLAAGEQVTKAYLLSADPIMSKTPLELSRAGNTVSVTVPTLWFWSLVVFS